ncbi:MAG: hypothetical protein FD153_225 [Rhodospirillaceae bacterium]|nr:MAG: hypothetical protein FD153_225 [Rhodospirillaceae bacterium]
MLGLVRTGQREVVMPRRSLLVGVAIALVAGGLSGCTETRKVLGYDKTVPDEFRVVARAPLTMPEAFDLPAPTPGVQRPQEQTPSTQAYQALLGRPGQRANGMRVVSPGIGAFLQAAGADRSEANIRAIVEREVMTTLLEQRSITDHMVFWRDVIPEGGPVVDAEKEQRRLRENQALGRPINTGEVPVQVPRRKGILEHLF